MATVFLGLGSNLGDREANIHEALDRLARDQRIRVVCLSSLYETAPIGAASQPDFLNAVAHVETDLGPFDLLHLVLGIERDMGRVRDSHRGPRLIDIDVLLYDDVAIETAELVIPHPRMRERAFVMAPLAEIAPDLELPDGRTPSEVLQDLQDQEVRRLAEVT